jgi:restriction system protein
LPSHQSTYLRNRSGWAGFHLRKAGLAELPREATLRITDQGQKFSRDESPEADNGGAKTTEEETTQERIETAFTELRETLVADLLARLGTVDPFRFEQVVLDLLVSMGYGGSRKEAAAVTQKTGGEGIDGVINEDRLGLDVIYIQAKRWKAMVGRPEIQSLSEH